MIHASHERIEAATLWEYEVRFSAIQWPHGEGRKDVDRQEQRCIHSECHQVSPGGRGDNQREAGLAASGNTSGSWRHDGLRACGMKG